MAKLDLLRKIIREEVKAVFQEELAGILKEAIMVNKGTPITEVTRPRQQPKVPATLNTAQPRVIAPDLGAKNPLRECQSQLQSQSSLDL